MSSPFPPPPFLLLPSSFPLPTELFCVHKSSPLRAQSSALRAHQNVALGAVVFLREQLKQMCGENYILKKDIDVSLYNNYFF